MTSIDLNDLEQSIRLVPDFPQAGILFRDITPLLSQHFAATIAAMQAQLSKQQWQQVDALVGIESRGFILAAGLAQSLQKGLILVRKPGKLPPPVLSQHYSLEYGQDCLEIGAEQSPQRVLLVDDVLATGGTLAASEALCLKAGHQVQGALVLMNLSTLNDYRCQNQPVQSLWTYH